MKQIISITLVALVIVVGAINILPAKSGDTVTLKVSGMVCGDCTDKVSIALKALDGIDKVVVDLKTGEAMVTYDSKQIAVPEMEKAVVAAGFDIGTNVTLDKPAKSCGSTAGGCCKSSGSEI